MARAKTLFQVDGVWIPDPSASSIQIHDISASDAGRDLTYTMHKERIGWCWQISLSWANISGAEVAEVLSAFKPEYFTVSFISPLTNARISKDFYRSDPTMAVYSYALGGVLYTSISFDIIQKDIQSS